MFEIGPRVTADNRIATAEVARKYPEEVVGSYVSLTGKVAKGDDDAALGGSIVAFAKSLQRHVVHLPSDADGSSAATASKKKEPKGNDGEETRKEGWAHRGKNKGHEGNSKTWQKSKKSGRTARKAGGRADG